MTPLDPARARRVLAARLDNVGDVVMLTPALRALRAWAPHARLTLWCSPAGAAVAPLLPWVDDVLVHRALWQDAGGGMPLDADRELAQVAELRDRAYDAAFLFSSFSQSPFPPAYACYLAGVPVRAGSSEEFGGGVLSHAVPPLARAAHQTARNVDLLRAVGVPVDDDRLELAVPEDAAAGARAALAAAGIDPAAPYVVAAPGASAQARRYPADRFAKAVRLIAHEAPVVVVGSARDAAPPGAFDLGEPGVASLVGRTTLPQLAALLRDAAAALVNNSGPMHLAEALGTPMVVTYSGAELESQWAPRHTPATLLRVPTGCSPCHLFDCPTELECLDLPPERVAAEVLAPLADRRAPA